MQKTPVHRFSSSRQTSKATHGNLDFSHTSTSSYATTTSVASSRRSKSFKEAAQHVAESFVSCFVPFSRNELSTDEHDVDHPIIHRDIKASNILITEKLRARVTDFGFARVAAEEPDVTHVITQVKGTAGYLDPEYLKTYQLTEKSDVYSFGVVLVEMVTGRRPIEPKGKKERMSTKWAMQKHNQGDTVMVMDPNLRRSPASIELVGRILDLAQQCIAPTRRSRPSMRKCAEILWDIRKDFMRPQTLLTSPVQSAHQRSDNNKHNNHDHDYYPEDNKERGKNKMKHQPERKNLSSLAKKHQHQPEKRKVPLSDDAKHDIQPNLDLSSSSSMNWGLRLIREGAAWEEDSPPYSTK